jgi:TolB-like protein
VPTPANLVHTGSVEPTADEVRQQLDRVLASEGFANADRMSGFLRYIVERSLSGEAAQVKEYAIGVDVFDRKPDYDPRLDSIVRVEARRLRSKVDEYYAGRGRDDEILIRLRRGSYVPAFERRSSNGGAPVVVESTAAAPAPTARSRTAWPVGLALALAVLVLVALAGRGGLFATIGRPAPTTSIAVLPFASYSTDPADALLAARLTDGVTTELARLGTIGVVSHTSALQFAEGPRRATPEIARMLRADHLAEGTVRRAGDRLEVSVRVVNGHTDRKMWVEDFVGSTGDPRDIERRIAQRLGSLSGTSR